MSPRHPASIAIFALVCLVAACENSPRQGAVRTVDGLLSGARFIDDGDSLPRIQYADGSVTLNDRCMVRRIKLNPKLSPVFVNGLPIGFC